MNGNEPHEGKSRPSKPDDFDKRDLCGAPMPDGGTCCKPANLCREHCGAFARGTGKPCAKRPVQGRKRCRLHGGESLIGIASPAYKTGRFSKLMPKGLRERFQAALNDPDLLMEQEATALWAARCAELIGKLNGSAKSWDDLAYAMDQKSKHAKLEWQRMMDMHELVTVEQVLMLVFAISDATRRHVKDPEILRALATEVAAIMNRRPSS